MANKNSNHLPRRAGSERISSAGPITARIWNDSSGRSRLTSPPEAEQASARPSTFVAKSLCRAWSEDKFRQISVAAHSIIPANVLAALADLSDAFYTDEPHCPGE